MKILKPAVVLGVTLVDQLTKLAALTFVPNQLNIGPLSVGSFSGGGGVGLSRVGSSLWGLQSSWAIFLFSILQGISVLLIRFLWKETLVRGVAYATAIVLLFFGVTGLCLIFPPMVFDPPTSGLLKYSGLIIANLIILWFTKDKVLQVLWSMTLGAALGNFLSYCWPPFIVTDFFSLEPFSQTWGWGAFNGADVSVFMALVVLAGYGPIYLYRMFKFK